MKRVELARARCQGPRLLLLDEPMAGMTFEEKVDMSECIIDAQEELGMSVLLIEHDMGIVMELAEHIVVLDFGRTIGDGTPAEIRQNAAVVAAYLGEDESDARTESVDALLG
jgi:branched-chain amino acid transport system ATP-binding protein